MRILVVEDERKAAAYLAKGLTENGFVVVVANTGDNGFCQVVTIKYELIVLDVIACIRKVLQGGPANQSQ